MQEKPKGSSKSLKNYRKYAEKKSVGYILESETLLRLFTKYAGLHSAGIWGIWAFSSPLPPLPPHQISTQLNLLGISGCLELCSRACLFPHFNLHL